MRPLILANLDKVVARLRSARRPVRDRAGLAFAVRAGLVVVDHPVDVPAVLADRPVDVDVRARVRCAWIPRVRPLVHQEVRAAVGVGHVRLVGHRGPAHAYGLAATARPDAVRRDARYPRAVEEDVQQRALNGVSGEGVDARRALAAVVRAAASDEDEHGDDGQEPVDARAYLPGGVHAQRETLNRTGPATQAPSSPVSS